MWEDLRSDVGNILRTSWAVREGAQVPETTDVALGNDAIKLKATVLYADMAESTRLVNSFKDWFAAEIYKCYLRGACRVVQHNGGVITAFDGDRVMAVFLGGRKNTQAVGAALEINHAVTQVINPMVKQAYPKGSFEMAHAVGVDTSDLFVARTGVRGSNDLVWVGRAANFAAKLCSFRDGAFSSWITPDVFGAMDDSVKYSKGDPKSESMWQERQWADQNIKVYGSTWRRSPT